MCIFGNIESCSETVISSNIGAERAKSWYQQNPKIPWTAPGLDHPSLSMPAACYATKHIVHDIYPCIGVYILFGMDMVAAA